MVNPKNAIGKFVHPPAVPSVVHKQSSGLKGSCDLTKIYVLSGYKTRIPSFIIQTSQFRKCIFLVDSEIETKSTS